MDRGARWATVHGVAKSKTRLNTHMNTRIHTHIHAHKWAEGGADPGQLGAGGVTDQEVGGVQVMNDSASQTEGFGPHAPVHQEADKSTHFGRSGNRSVRGSPRCTGCQAEAGEAPAK